MASLSLTAANFVSWDLISFNSDYGGLRAPVLTVNVNIDEGDDITLSSIDIPIVGYEFSIISAYSKEYALSQNPTYKTLTLLNNGDAIKIPFGTKNFYIKRKSDTHISYLIDGTEIYVINNSYSSAVTTGTRLRAYAGVQAPFMFVRSSISGKVILISFGISMYAVSDIDLIDYSITSGSLGYAVMAAGRGISVQGGVSTSLVQDLFTSGKMPTDDPYSNLPVGGDDPIPGGGTVAIPGLPGLTATSAGVIGLFVPTAGQMQTLADFMWTDFGGTGTTVEDILKEVVEALKRSISNPLDYIIGLNIIPSQGLSIGASKVVRFGFISSGVSMPVLANQYFTVDCGSLAFDTLCGDTFLDYAPYSKFSLYLPYIGFKDVDPNDFVGHTIGVVYHGDCVTGGVTAYVTKDGSVMYQYSGCCALNVPLSADNWGETISAAVNVATGIVAAAASGGAAGVALGAAKGAASVAANPSLLSPQVSHSGAVSGGAGCMGVQYPFVIREAVNFHSTTGFNKSSGYPSYYYKKFSDVSGYTVVLDAHLSNITGATQNEIDEIERLLESGVIL